MHSCIPMRSHAGPHLVVQCFGIGMALLSQCPQRPCIQRQPLVIMLHELCQIQQAGHDLWGDGGGGQGGLQAAWDSYIFISCRSKYF